MGATVEEMSADAPRLQRMGCCLPEKKSKSKRSWNPTLAAFECTGCRGLLAARMGHPALGRINAGLHLDYGKSGNLLEVAQIPGRH
jgi:hypothetical protein